MSEDRNTTARPLFEPSPGAPTREDVLDAAHALLASGLKALTVRALCDRLSTSRQLVYSRFGNKEGLLEALYVDGFRKLQERVETSELPRGSAERLIDHGVKYRAFALEHPHLFALMFFPTRGFEPSAEALAAAARSFAAVTVSAAEFMGVDPTDAAAGRMARDLWAATHGVVSLEGAGHAASSVEGMLGRMIASRASR